MGQGGKLLVLAAALGLLTAILVYFYVGDLTQGQIASQEQQMVNVVVARGELTPRTVITPDMVRMQQVPMESIHSDAAISFDQVNGRVVKSAVMAGEQVLTTRLIPLGEKPSLAFAIPADRRAITVPVNEVVGVAGFVQSGDRVDILSNLEDSDGAAVTIVLLQNVPVLAIDQVMESDLDAKPKLVTTVTLAVTLKEAQRLALAEAQGALRLALRPAGTTAKDMAAPLSQKQLLPTSTPSPPPPVNRTQAKRQPPAAVKIVAPKTKAQVVEIIRGSQREIITVD